MLGRRECGGAVPPAGSAIVRVGTAPALRNLVRELIAAMPRLTRPLVLLALIACGPWISFVRAQSRPAAPVRAAAPASGATAQPQDRRTAANPRTRYAPEDPPAAGGGTAGRPAAGAQATPAPPAAPLQQNLAVAPFVLTEAQTKLLEQVLLKWEQQSAKVNTYVCAFTRFEVDPTWGPKDNYYTLAQSSGTIKYKAPDRGEYAVEVATRWNKEKGAYVTDDTALERWMCDGQAIYEWDRKNKLLKVRPLPEELKGKAIADGPLPFVFGAKAEQLKRRYWMRDVTPTEDLGKKIWLDARPKFQQDAANFQRATVILNEKTFLPEALQLFPPGIAVQEGKAQANTAFRFDNPSVNNPLSILKGDFLPPITPPFWKKVVVEDPSAQPDEPLPPGDNGAPAARRPSSTQRK
jgi:TIGR03009 family protein